MRLRPGWVASVIAFSIVTPVWYGTAQADDRELCKTASGDVAIEACTRAIDSKKYSARKFRRTLSLLYTNRGVEYEIKQEFDRAILDHDEAIKIDPKNYAAYNNRGNAYAGKRDYARAIVDYDEAIKLNPKYADALFNRSNAKRHAGDTAGAEIDLAQAKELDPSLGQQR